MIEKLYKEASANDVVDEWEENLRDMIRRGLIVLDLLKSLFMDLTKDQWIYGARLLTLLVRFMRELPVSAHSSSCTMMAAFLIVVRDWSQICIVDDLMIQSLLSIIAAR